MLWTAAWVDRKRCADPGDLNRCIFRSRRRVGWWEFSARLLQRCRRSWRASSPSCRLADPYEPSPSVVIVSGAKPCFLTSLRMSEARQGPQPAKQAEVASGELTAARVSRRVCTRTSSTSPSSSTARQSQCRLPAIVITISSRCHRGRAWPPPPQVASTQRAELADPASDGFVAQVEAALGQHVLDITQAQREALVEPNHMLDDG